MINATIAGRFTKDIEVKNVGDSNKVIQNTVACDGGKDKTTFIDVKIWNKQAEIVEKFLTKGSFVILSGRIEQENWEKDGEKRSKLVFVAERLTLPPKSGGEGGAAEPAQKPAGKQSGSKDTFFEEDDIPF